MLGLTSVVVGGAGYIGSHMVKMLRQAGCHPVVVDDLSSGRREAAGDRELLVGDIGDQAFVEGVLRRVRPDAVMHFASLIQVGESRSEEHTSEHKSLMRITYAVFCWKK